MSKCYAYGHKMGCIHQRELLSQCPEELGSLGTCSQPYLALCCPTFSSYLPTKYL